MNNELAQVIGAKSRLYRLEPDDVRIIGPMLDERERELALSGEIQFHDDTDGFYVDGVRFPRIYGLPYLAKILAKPGRHVPIRDLTTVIGAPRQDILDRKTLEQLHDKKDLLIQEAKDLRERKRDPNCRFKGFVKERHKQLQQEIAELGLQMGMNTYGGKSKGFTDDFQKGRIRVKKAIDRAIDRLYTHPDDWNLDVGPRRLHPQTAHIGAHLKENVKTGGFCVYVGKWRFKTTKNPQIRNI